MYPPNKKIPFENYRYIQLEMDETFMEHSRIQMMASAENKKSSIIEMFGALSSLMLMMKQNLESPEIEQLKRDGQFDLVVFGAFFNDFQLGLAAHFKCPSVIISGTPAFKYLRDLVGAPSSVSYVRFQMMSDSTSIMTFKDRMKNYLIETAEAVVTNLIEYFYIEPVYNELFPSTTYPTFSEAKKNVSLIFVNSHISQGNAPATMPSIIEVSGIQVKEKPDPLPNDVQKWLDDAEHGAIFFSLGSNIKSSQISSDKLQFILSAFAKLKQRILWKWEDDELPNKPDNVMIGKWLPQDDILAHKNIRVFFSHCGKGSVNEAKYHGVPILGMAMFGDQPANLVAIREEGWAVALDYGTLTEDSLTAGLNEILNNSAYRNVVKTAADLYRDRPEHPLEKAVYWVEYVLRHKGAKHLQSHAVHMNWFQLNSYDVKIVIFGTIYLSWKCLRVLFDFVVKIIFSFRRKFKKD